MTTSTLSNCCTSCQHAISIISSNKGVAEKSSLLRGMEGLKRDTAEEKHYHHHQVCMKDEILKAPLETMANEQDDDLLEQVSTVKCTSCDKSIALLINGNYRSLHEFLWNDKKPDGWLKVDNEVDRLVLFVLNQIIYREYEVPDEDELQVEYAFPPKTDFTKILWMKGDAVGFYSVKPKGSLDLDSMDWYRMTVLDTLFIRHSERRKGYAISAVEDVLQEFSDQNIGFSMPISVPMVQVLKKHLMSHPADRMKLWEIAGCGLEGNCQILWFLFKRDSVGQLGR